MELSFKVDGLWFDAEVTVDEDEYMEFETLTCDSKDASFLLDSQTLWAEIEDAAWRAYVKKCAEMKEEFLIDRARDRYDDVAAY